VPALDAVMFLSARKSDVDIVQSVGRVMRKDPAGQGPSRSQEIRLHHLANRHPSRGSSRDRTTRQQAIRGSLGGSAGTTGARRTIQCNGQPHRPHQRTR
jgi:hypothetical protein